MPDSPTTHEMPAPLAGAKPTVRIFVLTLALLAHFGTLAYAQAGQPAPMPQNPTVPSSTGGTVDAEKMRVQARWDALPGSPSKKETKPGKSGKPVKPETATPSTDHQ